MQTQTDNDTPAEDLQEIFVVIFVAEFERAEGKKGNIHAKCGKV